MASIQVVISINPYWPRVRTALQFVDANLAYRVLRWQATHVPENSILSATGATTPATFLCNRPRWKVWARASRVALGQDVVAYITGAKTGA